MKWAEQGLLVPRLHTELKPCPAALKAPMARSAQTPGSEDGAATSSCLCELAVLGISFAKHAPVSRGSALGCPGRV